MADNPSKRRRMRCRRLTMYRPTLSDPRETSGPRTDRIPSMRPSWPDRRYRELKKLFFSPHRKCRIDRFGPVANRATLERLRGAARWIPDVVDGCAPALHAEPAVARQLRRSDRRAAMASARGLLAAGTPSPRRRYLGIKASTRRGQDGDFLSYVSGQGGGTIIWRGTRPPCSSSPSCGSPPGPASGTRRTSRYVFYWRRPGCF